ncbi:hypothetical protein ACFL1I_08510 [Candidatus Omnitrophota bacterium]
MKNKFFIIAILSLITSSLTGCASLYYPGPLDVHTTASFTGASSRSKNIFLLPLDFTVIRREESYNYFTDRNILCNQYYFKRHSYLYYDEQSDYNDEVLSKIMKPEHTQKVNSWLSYYFKESFNDNDFKLISDIKHKEVIEDVKFLNEEMKRYVYLLYNSNMESWNENKDVISEDIKAANNQINAGGYIFVSGIAYGKDANIFPWAGIQLHLFYIDGESGDILYHISSFYDKYYNSEENIQLVVNDIVEKFINSE